MAARTAIALLDLAGLTFAACGSDDPGTTTDVLAADLSGKGFASGEATGYEHVDGSEITMNQPVRCHDDGLRTATDGSDRWLGGFLASSPAIAVDGSTLTLTGADAST